MGWVMQGKIRVLIVDDHDLLRRGLRTVLKNTPDLEVTAEAASAVEALQLSETRCPDVVLMDLVMPGMNGIEATRAIRARFPRVQVIALTTYEDEDLVQSAIQAGAIGYLLKNVSPDELVGAIRAGAAGRSTLSPEAAHALVNMAHREAATHYRLTHRERQVLELMARGYSNKEIADILTVSLSTVKKHVGNILDKLNRTSRVEAVIFALQNDLVSSKS